MPKKSKPKRRRSRRGSSKRPQVGEPAKIHNAPRGKWIEVCGQVTRIGGALVEIPAK